MSHAPATSQSSFLQTGDMALVFSSSGQLRTFAVGIDQSRLRQPIEQMTEADKIIIDNGEKLFALTVAAQHPEIMQILIEFSNDPDVVDIDLMKQFIRRN